MQSLLIVSVVLAILMVSCQVPTPSSRIAENPAMFTSLPAEQQPLVRQGRICEGMKPDAVFLAWGKPNGPVVESQQNGRKVTRWVYNGYEPVTVMNEGMYPYCGPYGWYPYAYPSISTAYVPRNVAWVEFVNGKVTAWSRQSDSPNGALTE